MIHSTHKVTISLIRAVISVSLCFVAIIILLKCKSRNIGNMGMISKNYNTFHMKRLGLWTIRRKMYAGNGNNYRDSKSFNEVIKR